MSLEDDIELFEQVPTLAMLGEQALRVLAIGAETQKWQRGAVLYYAGDLADGGYVIVSGSVSLQPGMNTPDIEELVAGPGALLGELALVTDTVRPATATALEPSTVVRIPRSLFLKVLEGYPAGANNLRKAIAQRVDQWVREVANVRDAMDRPHPPRRAHRE